MSSVEEIAQKLIPCTCGGYGVNCTRHMTDCPRHAIAWEDIAAALASERAKFAAFADEKGEPRKVLGTLPVTADGCIVGADENVLWFVDRHAHKDTVTGKYQSQVKAATWSVDRGRFEFIDRDGWGDGCYPSECYSTKEAATSALAAAKEQP